MKNLFLFILFNLAITIAPATHAFNIQHWHTSNGTQVVFYQAMEVPMLNIILGFAAGSAYDGQQFGLSMLTANLLTQGSAGMDANTIAEKMAATGASFDIANNRDMLIASLTTLTEPAALNPAIQLFAQILSKPNFSSEAFNREKQQQVVMITQSQESPEDTANQALFKRLYQHHPYGHEVTGSYQSVKALTLPQVRQFYQRYLVASNASLVLVGALDKASAEHIAEQLTKNLPTGQPAAPIAPLPALKNKETINIAFPTSQTTLRLGQIGITHHDPDYFALLVGNHILGGGALVSRLADEVREKRGLSYSVNSQLMPMPGKGPFIISLATQNKQAKMALKITEEVLAHFISQGPTPEELAHAKQYLTGNFPLSLSSNNNIATTLLRMSFYHLSDNYLDTYIDRINGVTTADIQRAFSRLLDPKTMLLVRVGKL